MISTEMAATDLGISIETLVNLYQSIEKISSPASETAMDLLSQGGSAELMNFDDVREQLQTKNLSLGLWLQAVIDGEVATFKLRPWFIYDIENIHLAHFAFRRDQIREYISRNYPELNMPVSISDSLITVETSPLERPSFIQQWLSALESAWNSAMTRLSNGWSHCRKRGSQ